jgi:hypothetical protein
MRFMIVPPSGFEKSGIENEMTGNARSSSA